VKVGREGEGGEHYEKGHKINNKLNSEQMSFLIICPIFFLFFQTELSPHPDQQFLPLPSKTRLSLLETFLTTKSVAYRI
jgi:hypothetical protein